MLASHTAFSASSRDIVVPPNTHGSSLLLTVIEEELGRPVSELFAPLLAITHTLHPYAVIEEELGRPVSELFAEISERPVAAASLGQVYKGRLHSGEEVAIKVRRKGGGTRPGPTSEAGSSFTDRYIGRLRGAQPLGMRY